MSPTSKILRQVHEFQQIHTIKLTSKKKGENTLNTTYLLMARFDKPLIPLVEFCEEFLGLSPRAAKEKFNVGELDLPIFRVVNS
jgi:pyocin activator protein PrtN